MSMSATGAGKSRLSNREGGEQNGKDLLPLDQGGQDDHRRCADQVARHGADMLRAEEYVTGDMPNDYPRTLDAIRNELTTAVGLVDRLREANKGGKPCD